MKDWQKWLNDNKRKDGENLELLAMCETLAQNGYTLQDREAAPALAVALVGHEIFEEFERLWGTTIAKDQKEGREPKEEHLKSWVDFVEEMVWGRLPKEGAS